MTVERNLGPQPIVRVLEQHALSATDLVEASKEQLTHKMVARAMKGRRLTANAMGKVVRALNIASTGSYTHRDLFDYEPTRARPREDPV